MSLLALAVSGAVVGSTGAYAAQPGHPPAGFQQIAAVMGPLAIGAPDAQRDVIEPPSNIDPGMALDPPQTGAKMPVIHPQMPGGRVVVPR